MIQARDVDYRCGDPGLRGYLALDQNTAGKRPGVAVFHEGLGLGEFAMEHARRLAGRLRGARRRHVRRAAAGIQSTAYGHTLLGFTNGARLADGSMISTALYNAGRPPLLGVDEKPVR